MAGPLRVEHDVAVGSWVQSALSEGVSVDGVIPPVFEAYARILHPATLSTPASGATPDAWGHIEHDTRELTWAEAAEFLEERPGVQYACTTWCVRFGEQQISLPGGGLVNGPHSGDVPLPLLTDLVELLLEEHGDVDVLAGIWEGSGLDLGGTSMLVMSSAEDARSPEESARDQREAEAREREAQRRAIDPEVTAAMRAGNVLGLPREGQGRGHILVRGQLSSLADPSWIEHAGLGWRPDRPGFARTPNLLWPASPEASPAWMLATELDHDATFVGGSPRLLDRVLAHPRFEAERVEPSDSFI